MEEQQEEQSQRKPIAKPTEEHHVPTWLLVIIAVLVGAAVAGGVIYAWQRTTAQDSLMRLRADTNETIASLRTQLETARHALEMERKVGLDGQEITATKAPEGVRVELDDMWDLYINREKGFSIEIPRFVSDAGSCVKGEDLFEGEQQSVDENGELTEKMVPTGVFSSDTLVHITTEFQFLERGGACEQTDVTLDMIENERTSPLLTVHVIDLPDNESEHAQALDDFAVDVYGGRCSAGEVDVMGRVTLEAGPETAEGETCGVENYAFIYDEELGRAATYQYDETTWVDLDDNIRVPRNLTLR